MRLLLVFLFACGGNSLDAPDDCMPDELHVIHGDVDERIPNSSFAFGNALGEGKPGMLAIGDLRMPLVEITFTKGVPNGSTVPAGGCARFESGSFGDCETTDLDGLLFVDSGYYRFEIAGGDVQGCFRAKR